MNKRKIKIIFGISLLLILIYLSIFVVSYLFDYKKNSSDTTVQNYFIIPDLKHPAYMRWLDNENLLFSTYDFTSGTSTLITYNISERELTNNYSINKKGIFNVTEDNQTIFCSWINKQIFDLEDFATTITISEINGTSSKEIKKISIHETVSITSCDLTQIDAIVDSPVLQYQEYTISVDSSQVTSTSSNELDLKVIENYEIPEGLNIRSFIENPNKQYILIEDMDGVLLVSKRQL